VITAEQLAIEREPPIVVPAAGAVAPRNAHVWVLESLETGLLKNRGPKSCVLEIVTGKTVVASKTIAGRAFVELAPNEPLAEGTHHDVRMTCEYAELPKVAAARTMQKTLARFLTSAVVDTTPPAWEGFVGAVRGDHVTLELRDAPDAALLYMWRLGEEDGAPFDVRRFTRELPSPFAARDQRIAARVVDLAGNRSELRVLGTATKSPEPTTPFSVPSDPPPKNRTAWWILAAGIVAVAAALLFARRK